MSDTIGGYCFFDEDFDQNKPLDEPRLVDNGDVTANVFCNPDAHLLEMNSKSGLYPLYLACSIYSLNLSKPESDMPLEESQMCIRDSSECDNIVMDNSYVQAIPEITANSVEASLVHEAAIGKIAGEQLTKLMTLGLTEKEAEEQIVAGFLK